MPAGTAAWVPWLAGSARRAARLPVVPGPSGIIGDVARSCRSTTASGVARAPDGTALFAPRGELVAEPDGERVVCHLCGRAYRDLAASHVYRAHGLDPDAYRVLAGLSPRHALQSPARSERQAARMRVRIAGDPRIGAGMARGAALARSGELQQRARQLHSERPSALERERQLAEGGTRLGRSRAQAFRARREERAHALGFADLEAYYRTRYREQRVRLERLAEELQCAQSAVRGDLIRLGLGPDRTRSHGARWRPAS